MKTKCKCISYNQPKKYQKTPARKMSILYGIGADGKKVFKYVFIDECIADDLQKLWDNNIMTSASCCGHNTKPKNVVLSDEKDYKKAKKLLPDFEIYYWKLVNSSSIIKI